MRFQAILSAALLLSAAGICRADTVQLGNGDILHGEVMSLHGQELVLKSETLGEIKLDRGKVRSIDFGDAPVRRPSAQPGAVPGAACQFPPGGANAGALTPDDVVKQLQQRGLQVDTLNDLQRQMPLLADPAVQGYFNKTVGGLMSGELDVQDVRKDAVKARDQLKGLQKDLGESGGALDGYMNILNRFIDETDPKNKPGGLQPSP